MVELKHVERNQPLRIVCDASKKGLDAVLQQKWKTVGNTFGISVFNRSRAKTFTLRIGSFSCSKGCRTVPQLRQWNRIRSGIRP